MDDQGSVSIKLIAGFKKVLLLTNNIHLIPDALRTSIVVEVQVSSCPLIIYMNDQGSVSIKLIAGFKKVLLLTNNIHLIPDALRTSIVVEVQLPNVSVTQANSVPDVLVAGVHNVSLDANTSGWSQGDVGRAEASV
ncbi:hypothetical protein ACFE04_003570 [Oxalis oulophora]